MKYRIAVTKHLSSGPEYRRSMCFSVDEEAGTDPTRSDELARATLQRLMDDGGIEEAGEYIVSITTSATAWARVYKIEAGGLRIA
jgi:hypothetical protein